MSDRPMITVKEAKDRLGLKTPQQVHQLLKKCPDARVKDGKRTFIDWFMLEEWVAEHPDHGVGQGSAKRRSKVTDFKSAEQVEEERIKAQAKGYPVPFEQIPQMALWNKGKWRGWAFGACESVDDDLAVFITQAGKDGHWVPSTVAAGVASGEMFVLKPEESLRFFELQLLRVRDTDPRIKKAIKLIDQAAALLEEVAVEQPDVA